ncbi:MAG: hypothetical protein K8J31_03195 [Anaerolineae bacterium]|nr:hypothetical protein [Anaerolineae bacterium]
MNKNLSTYIAVALMLGTAVLVALGQRATDANRVDTLAHRIADFDLPADYRSDYAAEVLDYTIAAYRSKDEQSHLAFIQTPPGIIPDESAIAGYVPSSSRHGDWQAATVLSTEVLTIRSQPATLTISERTNGEGRRYRSANLAFQGRKGTALLVINQPVAQWDEASLDALIASIH